METGESILLGLALAGHHLLSFAGLPRPAASFYNDGLGALPVLRPAFVYPASAVWPAAQEKKAPRRP